MNMMSLFMECSVYIVALCGLWGCKNIGVLFLGQRSVIVTLFCFILPLYYR